MPLTEEQTAVATATTAVTTADEALKTAEAGTDEAVTTAAKEAQDTAKTTLETAEKTLADTDPADIKGDMKELLAKARKDEKDKMYGRVNKLEEEAKTSATEMKTIKDQNATLIKTAGEQETPEEKAKREKEAEDNKNKPPAGPSKEDIQGLLTEQMDKFEKEVFQPKLDALTKENADLKKENETTKLDSYKNELIAANKDSIIEELIRGTNTEELDTSLVEAKQAFVKYNIQATEKAETTADGTKLPPKLDLNGRKPSDPNYIDPSMSQAEYAKNRTELLKTAAASVRAKL